MRSCNCVRDAKSINLSHAAVLVLYHPETTQLHMNTSPLKIHGSDYYMFTSYVMPEAQLHISDGPDETGDYPVTFKVGWVETACSMYTTSLMRTHLQVSTQAIIRYT